MSGDVIGSFARLARDGESQRVPLAIAGRPGHFDVDAGWGTIQPLHLHPDLSTIAEIELIVHLDAGLPVIDVRPAEVHARGTIRGARSIPQRDLLGRAGEIDAGVVTALFCNGPQCSATPRAIELLLEAGHPPSMLRYYRGGIHDWVTLGLPLEGPAG